MLLTLLLSACLPIDLSSKVSVINDDVVTDSSDTSGCTDSAADEICNGLDDNCDGVIDDDAVDKQTFYRDGDGDGYGIESDSTEACTQPEGYAAAYNDCDDADATASPGLEESCGDFVDNDCDGLTDEDVDEDGDGWTTCGGDCEDDNGSINPDAVEVCDSRDNDCNGTVDDDYASDASTWYADTDGDTYGDPANARNACVQPEGYVVDTSDCDDTTAEVTTAPTWYADADHDYYGDVAVTEVACEAPASYVSNPDDCDDADAGINPDAAEVCDGIDQNCVDGIADEGIDGDGDGEASCQGDCDDSNAAINTSASEACDGIDNDCDGVLDNDVPTSVVYFDYDGDTYGDADVSLEVCAIPAGYVADGTDCDDTVSTINPSGTEVCNGEDDNCDGTIDETTECYDDDGDGYTETDGDCDDADALVSPAATEVTDGIDNDCDGYADEGSDAFDDDGDCYCEVAPCTGSINSTCATLYGDDCTDANGSISPGEPEICDYADDDCDGDTDEGVLTTYYYDNDLDGYGDDTSSVDRCSAPAGYVTLGGDCDETVDTVHPGMTEDAATSFACYDHVDNDCDTDDGGATGEEWDFGDSDCVSTSGLVADGPNLLMMEAFDDGDLSDWSDVPTGESSDDTLTFSDSSSGGPSGVRLGIYMYVRQSTTSSYPAREALCADSALTAGLITGDSYALSFISEMDSGAAVTIDVSWLEEYRVDYSAIDLEPAAVYGDWDTVTIGTAWAGTEMALPATSDTDMVFCFGVDEGDIRFTRPSIRHAH